MIKEIIKIISFSIAAIFYVYIILSERSGHFYIGYNDDPDRRLFEHNNAESVQANIGRGTWFSIG
jgi:predicted GIY-YIG superfamily endonuclease